MPLNNSSLDKNPQHLLRTLAQRVSQAVWLEQEFQIIANLAKLANCALASGYVRPKEGAEWPIDYAIIPAIKQLFHIIDRCAAGKIDSYSDLYSLCNQLTHRLLNAKDDQPYYPETINAPVYVGVAPVEVDEDFDFEQAIQDIHIELKGLNAEAVQFAAQIEQNFSELF